MRTRLIALALAAAGAALMAVGFARGDTLEIFRKASFVCMECVGIG